MEVVMDLRVRTWPMRSSLARKAVRAGSSSSCCWALEEEPFLGAIVLVRWRDEGGVGGGDGVVRELGLCVLCFGGVG